MTEQTEQAAELQRLQAEIDAAQAETATVRNKLIQTQARNAVGEAEITTERSKVVQMQIGVIMRETEAQA
jgi:septal ring factor EnvC (AmiA/AmiB activator)